MNKLADDPRVQRTRFVVIDFEGLTPAGRPPVPIEVAAVTVMLSPTGQFTELDCYESLMAPPPDVPITRFDQASGITKRPMATAPAASAAMSELDRRVHAAATDAGHAVLLVAHHAATERTLLHGQRSHCPRRADTSLLDTVRLARACQPELALHSLDHLARHLQLQIPRDRNRALADVRLTLSVFQQFLRAVSGRPRWTLSASPSFRRRSQARTLPISPASSDRERIVSARRAPRTVHRLSTPQTACG
ncbi:3'-5' exonuclease [Amycolatopsis sp. DG1A-15b]|uniref:exonuclease domain-containing protein n=1 Tax=Amycolatopsis sp. DG1A-15b TaxID=3052846 RepID=UPI00255BA429|nr:3'-5' exonuclease [Amycolatopsis sp. DG1A-15b]WIX85725.1 3'-5' exonuclease [Amycolatopsis sp. DG1A-15b]